MRTQWLVVFAALLAFLAYRNGPFISIAFTNPDLPPAYFATPAGNASAAQSCKTVKAPELKYCEDASLWDVDWSNGLKERFALVSCDANRKRWNTVMGPLRDPSRKQGSLWAFSFDENGIRGKPHRLALEGYPGKHEFHPLGIEAATSKDGAPANMFVVNHAKDASTIEQFIIVPPTVTDGAPRVRWVRTIRSKYLVSPNSVALTSAKSFFVSNDHLMTRRLPWPIGNALPMAETLLALPLGFIGHVALLDGPVKGEVVVRHTLPQLFVPFPNGIALHPDGNQLAVVSSSLTSLLIYNRTKPSDPESGHPGELKHIETIRMPFAPDNVMYDDDGVLLVAGHPYFPALTAISRGTSKTGTAPSWVVELVPRTAGEAAVDVDNAPLPPSRRIGAPHKHYAMKTIYQSRGLESGKEGAFSSSATGLRDSRTGTVIISGLYAEEGVLVCASGIKPEKRKGA